MAVTTLHALYTMRADQWQRCRDAIAGNDAVKGRGEQYLSKLIDQSEAEFKAYMRRSDWYGASARTAQGLVGAVTRKDPKFDVPTVMDEHLKDMTLTGVSATQLVKHTLTETLITGRCGVLVDMSESGDHATARPYCVLYRAEQIINWRTTVEHGVVKLVLVVLQEEAEEQGDDEFEVKSVTKYRVLSLDEKGVYVVRIFTPVVEGDQRTFEEKVITPTYRGDPMKEIPFCFFGPSELSIEPEKPPLLDVVDMNYSHYRSSADLEHGRHFCGLPTPWIAGFPKDTVLRIGSSVAWVSQDANAKAGMLEFTGQGLGALEKALQTKEQQMAVLGARLLEEQKLAAEAAETLQLRGAGERSVLQSMAVTQSVGWTKILRWHAKWMGVTDLEAIMAELNTDFQSGRMPSADLAALVGAWQANAISYETLYWNLQRGEIARPGLDVDEEQQLIEEQTARDSMDLEDDEVPPPAPTAPLKKLPQAA